MHLVSISRNVGNYVFFSRMSPSMHLICSTLTSNSQQHETKLILVEQAEKRKHASRCYRKQRAQSG